MPFPSPGDLPDPGIEHASLKSPASTGRFSTTSITQGGTCSSGKERHRDWESCVKIHRARQSEGSEEETIPRPSWETPALASTCFAAMLCVNHSVLLFSVQHKLCRAQQALMKERWGRVALKLPPSTKAVLTPRQENGHIRQSCCVLRALCTSSFEETWAEPRGAETWEVRTWNQPQGPQHSAHREIHSGSPTWLRGNPGSHGKQ